MVTGSQIARTGLLATGNHLIYHCIQHHERGEIVHGVSTCKGGGIGVVVGVECVHVNIVYIQATTRQGASHRIELPQWNLIIGTDLAHDVVVLIAALVAICFGADDGDDAIVDGVCHNLAHRFMVNRGLTRIIGTQANEEDAGIVQPVFAGDDGLVGMANSLISPNRVEGCPGMEANTHGGAVTVEGARKMADDALEIGVVAQVVWPTVETRKKMVVFDGAVDHFGKGMGIAP